MTHSPRSLKHRFTLETAIFLGLLLVGILVLPAAIFVVGQMVFGDYGGTGFSDFYSRLHFELRSGRPVAWYLVLSPYFALQLLRLTIWGFSKARKRPTQGNVPPNAPSR